MVVAERLLELRRSVCDANLALQAHGLVIFTWGNVSAIERSSGLVVIKPSGVGYDELSPEKMVVVDLNGQVVEGDLNPSSDTPTHVEIYKKLEVEAIAHTHSTWATTFAQLGMDIPALGTTHADHFYGPIPCTREMTSDEIADKYEENTGRVINELFEDRDPSQMPGVLVRGHGPFVWGKSLSAVIYNSVVLEYVARMAHNVLSVNPSASPLPQELLDRHFLRKNGAGRYYGQVEG